MDIIEGIDSIKNSFNNAVVTIGNFDGVHKGHKALFDRAIEKAREIKGTSVAITFEPHPIRVLTQDNTPPLITLYKQKVELIAKTGIDILITIPFTKEFSELSAREFVETLLVKKVGMKAIIVGNDYNFGKNREGDITLLHQYAEDMDFEVIIPDWINISDSWTERVSSTKIREIVMEGRVSEAPDLLGRHYQIRGEVVSGRDRGGKLLGFPTANINLYDELCPKTGVYAVTVECTKGVFDGVANIGYSPTFDDHIFTIEVHILDFNDNIYGETIHINMIERLRDEAKFESLDALIDQIKKDVVKAKKILGHKSSTVLTNS